MGFSLLGIQSLFTGAAKHFAFDKAFDVLTGKVTEVAGEKFSSAIAERAEKWWGLDRSDDQLLLALYTALYTHYESEYEELRKALDILWTQLLAIDNGRGKWAKRWRMTYVGLDLAKDASVSVGRVEKSRTPMLNKEGKPILGPDGKPLEKIEYEDKKGPLAMSKEDPRLKHLYVIGKMASEELASGEPNCELLPKTINHLMVTYLQDDPFIKTMGEFWGRFILWLESCEPSSLLRMARGYLLVEPDVRRRIQQLPAADRPAEMQRAIDYAKQSGEERRREIENSPAWKLKWVQKVLIFPVSAIIILAAIQLLS